MNRERYTRRNFLSASVATVAIPTFLPRLSFASRRVNASDRVNVAMIGCGKMAFGYHLPQLLKQKDVQLVAVSEVDTKRRNHALEKVSKHYAADDKANNKCEGYNDFRKIIEREDVDAVCIATPDHWHATPLIEACKAGMDVYCEKPLTLTIAEAQRCVEAARIHKRIVQTGSQQRSNVFGKFREAVEIIRSGRLGKIHKVTVGVGEPSVPYDLRKEEMETGLDWDMWLGQAPAVDYNSVLSPRGIHNHFPAWRKYREFSGGGHTDMGAHHYDIALWALDLDSSGPTEIVPPDDPSATRGVRFLFENGSEIVHGGPGGCEFHGENGSLRIDRGHLSSNPESIVKDPLGKDDLRLPVSPGHHRDWLDCIKSRKAPVAEVEKGARTVTMIHLGNLAYWNQKTLRWNPKSWKFQDESDNSFLDRKRRDPWQLPEV